MNDPKVSIVLPTYNGEKYLQDAIQSCLEQTHRNIELIVVDDCSTDSSPEIIRSFNDPRIKYIRNETNQRLPRSLNIGFSQSTGEYLTWTSDDNEFLPNAIEKMLSYLDQNPDVDFVYTDMEVVDLTTGQQTLKECTHWTFYFENIIGASYLYRRRVFETIGGYDPNFEWVEDYDYWLRVEKKFKMRRLPEALYLYGNHPNSLTSRKLYQVDILANLLRYHHDYLAFDGLVDGIGKYVVKFFPFRKGSGEIWGAVLPKVSRLPAKLRMAFWSSIFAAIGKKGTTALGLGWRKFLKLFGKDRDFTELLSVLPQGDRSRKRILCIIPTLTMGGLEKVMQDIVRGLTPKGYDFHLFCFKQETGAWTRKFLSHFASSIVIPPAYDLEQYTDYLIRILKKLDIQMILLSHAHVAYKALPKIKELFPQLKVVDILHLERVGSTHQHISEVGAPHIDRRVCISHHLSNYMSHEYGVWGLSKELAQRLDVIHNGTHVEEFTSERFTPDEFRKHHGIPAGKKIISFASRMAPEKNPFTFLDIAREILSKDTRGDVHFVMAGDGPLLSPLRAKIKGYGLSEHFTVPGALTNMGELLRDSYIFTVVSTHEGIPLSIQEAMHMGVPVVSTRVGAIHEIVKDGKNGFLIARDPRVVDNAAEKILYLLNHEDERAAMSIKAKEAAYPEFALETMCRRYEEVFAEVLR